MAVPGATPASFATSRMLVASNPTSSSRARATWRIRARVSAFLSFRVPGFEVVSMNTFSEPV